MPIESARLATALHPVLVGETPRVAHGVRGSPPRELLGMAAAGFGEGAALRRIGEERGEGVGQRRRVDLIEQQPAGPH